MIDKLLESLPGMALKVGVTKKKKPFARMSTNIGGFHLGKNVDFSNKGQLAAAGAVALLFAKALSENKPKAKSKKKSTPETIGTDGVATKSLFKF